MTLGIRLKGHINMSRFQHFVKEENPTKTYVNKNILAVSLKHKIRLELDDETSIKGQIAKLIVTNTFYKNCMINFKDHF